MNRVYPYPSFLQENYPDYRKQIGNIIRQGYFDTQTEKVLFRNFERHDPIIARMSVCMSRYYRPLCYSILKHNFKFTGKQLAQLIHPDWRKSPELFFIETILLP